LYCAHNQITQYTNLLQSEKGTETQLNENVLINVNSITAFEVPTSLAIQELLALYENKLE